MDGPRVGKAAPVVITFKNRKDKEQLMWRCKDKLRKAGILVTEDSQVMSVLESLRLDHSVIAIGSIGERARIEC